MINVIHAPGTSFKGLATYLLHDKDADTSDRVAWTHTHNLATEDPHVAWKIMAATAMQQSELKRAHDISAAGRKSKTTTMHYTLSWHADERDEITRDEMVQAALASLTYVGTQEGERLGRNRKTKKEIRAIRSQFADEHQAVIVCHDDGSGSSPHIHIMLNRVHPEHGVMLPDSKDYEKLSAWALEYRQAHGKEDYCPQRVKNAAARAQGFLTSNRRRPRNVYEQEQAIRGQDPRRAELLEKLKRRAGKLRDKHKAQHARHVEETRRLEDDHLIAEKLKRVQTTEQIRAAKARIKTESRAEIDRLIDHQADERQAFDRAQESLRGRAANAWTAIKTKEWMTEIRQSPLNAVTQAFGLAFSSGMQLQQLKGYHAREEQKQHTQRKRDEKEATRQLRSEMQEKLEEQQRQFASARNDQMLKQDMENAKQKAEWLTHENRRQRVSGFQTDPDRERTSDQTVNPSGQQTTTPTPQIDGTITQFQDRMRQRNADRERDDGDRGR